MSRMRFVALVVGIVAGVAGPGTVRGESAATIEPAAGLEWNDRVPDVQRKLAAFPEIRRVEISVLFNDTVTSGAFGPRAIAAGSEKELSAAVSSLVGEYLAGVEADRRKGTGNLAKAFDLHCADILADKGGARRYWLDVTLRMAAKAVRIEGVPFDLTAEFRAHPGAGLTGRYTIPVQGTKYVLPVVLTKVTLVPASLPAGRKFFEVTATLRKDFARFRRLAAGTSEAWCDDRQVAVSFVSDAAGAPAIRYDAETHWFRGLDAMYKDHVNTLNGGKSCRCHAAPAAGRFY